MELLINSTITNEFEPVIVQYLITCKYKALVRPRVLHCTFHGIAINECITIYSLPYIRRTILRKFY